MRPIRLATLAALSSLALLPSASRADEPRSTLGAPFFEALEQRARSAFDDLDASIKASRERADPALNEARAKAERDARVKAEQAAAKERAEREAADRETARIAAEREAAAREASRLAAERDAAQRAARAAEARALAEQARRAEERRVQLEAEQARRAADRRAEDERRAREQAARSLQGRILALVNIERSRGALCGGERFGPAPALAPNALLDLAAQRHAEAMARERFFDHRDPHGNGPRERITATGYVGRAWGENIAAGQPTAEVVVDAWMLSPGHCRNIMNPMFNELGVGVLLNLDSAPYPTYWVQNFGKR